jgi:DNA-directed RNA polymerase beta subunit
MLQQATSMLANDYKFVDDGRSDFDNLIIRFTIATSSSLVEGSKISGRYGNKGTVSKVLPDNLMPIAEDGQRADIILNVLGVVGRLNPSQLFEQEINFMANELVKRMKDLDTLDQYKLYWKFIKAVVPSKYAQIIRKRTCKLSDEDLQSFMDDVIASGIRVLVSPYYGCLDFFQVSDLYKQFNIEPLSLQIPAPEGVVSPVRKLVIGNMYFMRLKHDAEGKFSARSAGALSLASIPSKNNKSYKESKAPYPKTAVRLGEMELVNMFALGDINELYRVLSLYSSSEADRREIIRRLLGVEMQNESIYDIKKVEKLVDAPSLPQTVLSEYFACMGLELMKKDSTPVIPVRVRRNTHKKG